jgi:hypothetical protein
MDTHELPVGQYEWSRAGVDLVAAVVAGTIFVALKLLVESDGPWDFVPPTVPVFAYFLVVWWRRHRQQRRAT